MNLSHELCKQLQKAGFIHTANWQRYKKDIIPNPTLTELLEACRNKFDRLEKDNESRWGAFPIMEIIRKNMGFRIDWEKIPEDAVAQLWLKLNKT